MAVIYNPETEKFIRDPATIIDSSAGGDTVKQGFEDRTEPALEGIVSAFNLLKTDGMIGVGVPATETARGISRVATKAEARSGVTGINGPAFVSPEQLSIIFGIRPGMPVPMAGTKLYPNCVWPDRSLVLFADWPDLKAEYDAGYILTATEAGAATYSGRFVLKADGSGLYLPDIGGLFARAWREGAMNYGFSSNAGDFQDDAMRKITGEASRDSNTGLLFPGAVTVGAFSIGTARNATFSAVTQASRALKLDTSLLGANYNGTETRPKNYAQPIAIFLGRHASEV